MQKAIRGEAACRSSSHVVDDRGVQQAQIEGRRRGGVRQASCCGLPAPDVLPLHKEDDPRPCTARTMRIHSSCGSPPWPGRRRGRRQLRRQRCGRLMIRVVVGRGSFHAQRRRLGSALHARFPHAFIVDSSSGSRGEEMGIGTAPGDEMEPQRSDGEG